METVDYLQPGDIGFKKPKARQYFSIHAHLWTKCIFFQTKKKRSTRQREQADPMEEVKPGEINRASAQSYNPDANFVDDEELQAALARSRRAKPKKPKKGTKHRTFKRL